MKQPNFLEEKFCTAPYIMSKSNHKEGNKEQCLYFFRLNNTIIYKEIKQNCALEGLPSELFIELLLPYKD